VLAEGGPQLNGALVRAGLVDEWNLTVAPVLAAGEGGPPAVGSSPEPLGRLRLHRVLEGDGLLFLRHVRA
jgi:riboflavin biosynthesis pyrimidine reductase